MGWTKKLQLEEADYKVIEALSATGLTIDQMAAYFKVAKKTFERELEDNERLKITIEQSRAKAIAQVTGILWELITKKKQPAMIAFYLKCRAGWKETSVVESRGTGTFTFKKTNG